MTHALIATTLTAGLTQETADLDRVSMHLLGLEVRAPRPSGRPERYS